MKEARRSKEALTNSEEVEISLQLDSSDKFETTLSRTQFEQLIATHINKTIVLVS